MSNHKLWLPEFTLKAWFKRNPQLKEILEGATCSCGLLPKGLKPIVFGDFEGVQAETCECGCEGISAMTPRNEKTKKKWLDLVTNSATEKRPVESK